MAKSKAILEIVTDLAGLDKGLTDAKGKVLDFTGIAKTAGTALAGAFAVTSIASAAADIVGFAGELSDMSAKTGIGVEALQEFNYAAEQSGFELSTLTTGIGDMQKRIAGGDASAVGALTALGLSLDDIRAMKPEDQFKLLADRVADIEDPADRVKVAMDLFGDSGRQMLPLLTQDIEALTGRAQALGLVMDKETVASMDLLGDTVGDLMNVGMALLGKLLAPLVPMLTVLSEAAMGLADVLGDVLGWAMEKVGVGVKWLAGQYINLAQTILGFATSIANTFPSLSEKLGITRVLAKDTEYLAKAEAWLTQENEAVTTSTAAAGAAARRLNLDYRANAAAAKKATEETKEFNSELKKTGDMLPGVKQFEGVTDFFAQITPRKDDWVQWGEEAGFSFSGGLKDYINDDTLAHMLDQIELKTITPSQWGNKAGWSFSDSFTETVLTDTEIVRGLERAMDNAGDKGGEAIKSATEQSLEALPGVIVGALQGGGNWWQAATASIGAGIGADLSKKIKENLTGMAGSLLSGLAGVGVTVAASLVGKLFSGNDTKKAREQAAKMLGFPTLDALYTELRSLGEDGAKLVHDGLNVIGKKDTAANQQWIASVEELIARNKELAAVGNVPEGIVGFPTKAELDAAATAAGEAYAYMRDSGLYTADVLQQAWDKWQDALVATGDKGTKALQGLKAEMQSLDDEYNSVFGGIAEELANPEYDEAGNRIYGVIEAQGLARLEAIDAEREALREKLEAEKAEQELRLEEAGQKVIDVAGTIHAGIQELFNQAIEVPYVFRQRAGDIGNMLPNATFGGAMASGGFFHVTKPTYFLAGEKPGGEDVMFSGVGRSLRAGSSPSVPSVVSVQVDGYELARAVLKHEAEAKELAGW